MTLVCGLCASRHLMPTETYVFPYEIEDVRDIAAMQQTVASFMEEHGNPRSVRLYVTGLTVALVEVINYCRSNDVKLTLLHFDRFSADYFEQVVC